jgi:thiol-disulfide isomerase/thioredoxin
MKVQKGPPSAAAQVANADSPGSGAWCVCRLAACAAGCLKFAMTYPAIGRRRLALIGFVAALLVGAARLPAKAPGADAWKQILDLNATIEKEQEAGHKATNEFNLMRGWLEHYIKTYPGDKNSWDARLILPEVKMQAAAGLGQAVDPMTQVNDLEAVLDDPALPADVRPRALGLWTLCVDNLPDKLVDGSLEKQLLQRMDEMGRTYPKHPLTGKVQLQLARRLESDPARCEAALKIAQRSSDPQVAARAECALAVLPYKSKPLDLKFTAADGRKVDLAELRGKVVLVDFWATWCGPCRREIPNVVNAFRKYHAQGFEIVGVSLDEDKKRMMAYTKEQGMTWPQYFDGAGWDTKVSRRFAITSIPTMWLLDREGRVISSDVWGELDEAVAAALARTPKS